MPRAGTSQHRWRRFARLAPAPSFAPSSARRPTDGDGGTPSKQGLTHYCPGPWTHGFVPITAGSSLSPQPMSAQYPSRWDSDDWPHALV